jgi:hypothetical protein
MSVLIVLFCAMTAKVDDCKASPYDRVETVPMVALTCTERVEVLRKAGGPSGGYYAIFWCELQGPKA